MQSRRSHGFSVWKHPILFGFLTLLSAALSACTSVPFVNILSLHQSQDHLYIVVKPDDKHSGYIKVLDLKTNQVTDTIAIKQAGKSDITALFPDKDSLNAFVRDGQSRMYLYEVLKEATEEGARVRKLGMISPYASLFSGADQDFFYAVSTADKKGNGVLISGIRYDKMLKGQMVNHFNENPNLVVISISEDADSYWYLCLERRVVGIFSSIGELSGRMVLVKRSKGAKEYTQFDYTAEPLRSVYGAGDDKAIWVFATTDVKDGRGSYTDHAVIKFSKADQKFEKHPLPMPMIPFPHQWLVKESDHLWALGYDNRIIRISKKDYTYVATAMPRHFRTYNSTNKTLVFLSTDDSLFVGAYDFKNKVYKGTTELPTPYVLRFSKSDMKYEQILVKPTTQEALKTGAANMCLGVYRGCWLEPTSKYERHNFR